MVIHFSRFVNVRADLAERPHDRRKFAGEWIERPLVNPFLRNPEPCA
jgi:hypothetical protein